jgi:hypothetical protein
MRFSGWWMLFYHPVDAIIHLWNIYRYRQSLDAIRPLIKDLKILGEYKSS